MATTAVFLLAESHGQGSLVVIVLRVTKSRTLLKQLSMHTLKKNHSKLNLSSVLYRGSKLIDYNEDTHLKHIDFTKTFDRAFYFTEILGK